MPNQRPVASAGPDQLTQTLTAIAFSAAGSLDPDGTITAYAWRFGDGAVASGPSASHAYARPGTYTVDVTVTDNGGLSASDTAMVVATNRAPTANAGPDQNGTAGTAVTLRGSGTDPDGTIAGYAWAFGDGQSAAGAVVSHAYAAAGVYVATLTVTDDSGARASDSAVVIVSAPPLALPWLRRLGGAGSDLGQAVAVAPNGDVVVAGYFAGTVDFGGGSLVATGAFDLFVARYTAAGVHLWSRRFGGTDLVVGQAVAVGPNGDVAVTGYFTATADLGGGPLTSAGLYDIFLAVYSATGGYKWARRFGGTSDDIGYGVAADAGGNVFLTGFFRLTADFGGGAFTSVTSGLDSVVAKYAATDGAHLWSRKFTNSSTDIGYAVAVDAGGNAVVGGSFMGRLNLGCGEMTSAGLHDAFVARLAGGTGACLWSRRYGGTNTDRAQGVAVGPDGRVAVTGFFTYDVDFGTGLVTSAGANDAFVAVLGGTDGATRWARGMGGRYGDAANGVGVLANGDVVVTGFFQDTADLGAGPLASAGLEDAFVARYAAATGAGVWARRYGATSTDYGYAVAGAGDHAVVTGYFQGTADFGTGPTSSAGLHDAFLVGLGP